jgi:hypothetical protein
MNAFPRRPVRTVLLEGAATLASAWFFTPAVGFLQRGPLGASRRSWHRGGRGACY